MRWALILEIINQNFLSQYLNFYIPKPKKQNNFLETILANMHISPRPPKNGQWYNNIRIHLD